ncbi:MAG TPA: hypothetical protein VHV77_00725, partial [Pirellulales bacterium]|nr:hypothetical protein [Pirellulales bacterium]
MPPADSTIAPTTARPWYRLHAFTIVAGCLATALLVVVVVPGELKTSILSATNLPAITCTYDHGWPWTFARRECDRPNPTSQQWFVINYPSWFLADAWTFRGMIVKFGIVSFISDMVVVIGILIALIVTVEAWRRSRSGAWQIEVRESLLLFVIIAVACAWLCEHWTISRYETELQNQGSITLSEYYGPEWFARLTGRRWTMMQHVTEWQPFGEHELIPRFAPHLPFLKTVSCQDTGLAPRDIAALSACRRLRSIELVEAELTDDMFEAIAKNQQLSALAFENCGHFNSAGIASLRPLRSLKKLVFGLGTTSDDRLLAELSAVEKLDDLTVSEVPECESGLFPLAKLIRLKSLTLGGEWVMDDELVYLRPLQNLETLDLWDSDIHGNGLCHL